LCTLLDVVLGNQEGQADHTEPGVWLPLTDAVRDVATLRRIIYRLVGDGKLRSREHVNGEIEIWIRDDDLVNESSVRPLNVIGPGQSPLPAEYDASAIGHQFAVLIGPLASSFERNVQLAHENGVLSERAASLERDLKALRDATASDKRALEHATERLRALEAIHAQSARTLSAGEEDRSGRQRWSWVWLAIGALLCLAAAVVWFISRPL
jgi:hypothetical protein